jgi:hypothetical protein
MNKFPSDFSDSVLVGRTLQMICFTANQIIFHFDERISISALTAFTCETASEADAVSKINVPAIQSSLMSLLEHRVSETLLEEQHILTLVFDGGYVLRFADDAPGVYESYHLTVGDKRIII